MKENFISQNTNNDDLHISNPMKITGTSTKQNEHREGVLWSSPPLGWLKANFDGYAKENLGKARFGGVLRDHYRIVVDSMSIPIGHSTSYKAEAIAALYTVKMAVETGYRNLWLEGNSLNIINMLNNKNMVTWNIDGSIMEIKNLINFFDKVMISYNF